MLDANQLEFTGKTYKGNVIYEILLTPLFEYKYYIYVDEDNKRKILDAKNPESTGGYVPHLMNLEEGRTNKTYDLFFNTDML